MAKQKLTQKFVERITPPKTGKADYFDTETQGLLLRVMASGVKTFSCRYRDLRGKQVERKLGNAKALKLSDARQLFMDIQVKLARGEDLFEERRALKKVPTFADFVAQSYLPHVKGYKRSWQMDDALLRNHVLPIIGPFYLDDIKRQHIVDLLSAHRLKHAPASTNRIMILIRYIFNCALKWEVEGLSRNPTSGIEQYPMNNKRQRYLNDEEAARLFESLATSPNPLLPYIVAMLLLTGARKREVLDAKWQDFDTHQRLWRIEFNKSGKTRYVPLSDSVLVLLDKIPRLEGNEYVFPNPKTQQPFYGVFNSWNSARKRAGLSDVRMHDLRHSFASYVINQGHSLYEVQHLLGHTQVSTTQRYAHLTQDSLLNAANSAAAMVPWEKTSQKNQLLSQKPLTSRPHKRQGQIRPGRELIHETPPLPTASPPDNVERGKSTT